MHENESPYTDGGMTQTLKLTSFSHGAGCACKLGLADLSEVLGMLGPPQTDPDVLVGLGEADDAAVVRIDGIEAIVLTLDFFTPLVDDAFTWGQIAAANAASDVYAMGGRPIVALNIVAWPRETIPLDVLAEVLRGGREVADRGGFVICGGHTVDDPEPKYGLVVIGRASTEHIMTIDAAKPGDVLVLTKPIGTGVITTAIKRDAAPRPSVDAAVASMTRLSDVASAVFVANDVKACTDVTGFSLVGHLHRMLGASKAGAVLDATEVPLIPGARRLADDGFVPGGSKRNREALDPHIDWDDADETTRALLCDAQTSGGLLAAVPEGKLDDVLRGLDGELVRAVIGRVTDDEPGRITVRGSVA
jgi:selenide,water dikinase